MQSHRAKAVDERHSLAPTGLENDAAAIAQATVVPAPEPSEPFRRYTVGLGANLGDRLSNLKAAIVALGPIVLEGSLRQSSWWASEAIDGPGPGYVNAVIEFTSDLGPRRMLEFLHSIEANFGRKRSTPNAARTLDLDILLADDLRLEEADLQIPHPRMHQRAFVLRPLLELDPQREIPGLGPAAMWLAGCSQQLCVRLET